MGATAILRGALPRFARGRPSSRLTVLAWALGAVALTAAAVSLTFSGHGGASAVVQFSVNAAEAAPLETTRPAGAALIDPAQFRRTAPPPDGRPRIALILRGLGLSHGLTADAITKLPADLTLALSAYGHDLQKTADAARGAGHEVFLDVPLEPPGYPANDAGPEALLTALPPAQNAERLAWSMARFIGYPGVLLGAASPPLDSKDTIAPLIASPAAHGLIWVHPKANGFDGTTVISVEIALAVDERSTPQAIDAALGRLEALARQNGAVLGVANAYPVTVDRLAAWNQRLEEHGIALVPASALAVTPGS